MKKAKRAIIESFITPIRKKSIKEENFTIISNNCWAGRIYQRYSLQFRSPTVGLYFFADDYIKFLPNLKYYMDIPMKTIPVTDSVHYEILKKRNELHCPIGKLDDIEIVFLHYSTAEEAIEKWERRKKRINWDNLIIKFSNMNCCSDKNIETFLQLPY